MPENPYFVLYEDVCERIKDILRSSDELLRGWHCTRLTDTEIEHIKRYGMRLPNLSMLKERIKEVQNQGLLSESLANQLIQKNQADDNSRKNMLWFCFFHPVKAGQISIERFFRRWGGEALYNYHEDNPETGEALRTIGHPCLIEADIPIATTDCHWIGKRISYRYLAHRGFQTDEYTDHEDRMREPLPAQYVRNIYLHGESEFSKLTGCDTWNPPL